MLILEFVRGAPKAVLDIGSFTLEHFQFLYSDSNVSGAVAPAILSPVSPPGIVRRPKSDSEPPRLASRPAGYRSMRGGRITKFNVDSHCRASAPLAQAFQPTAAITACTETTSATQPAQPNACHNHPGADPPKVPPM
jgi:hypothetical protein